MIQSNVSDAKSLVHSPAGQFEETRFEKIHNVIHRAGGSAGPGTGGQLGYRCRR